MPTARDRVDARAAFASLAVSELREFAVARLGRGGRLRPDVFLLERGGARAVLKDFGARGFRAAIGRFLVAREARAYALLEGEESVPRLFGRVGAGAILLEWRDAEPLPAALDGRVSDMFFVEVSRAIERLHARGVAHLDLRQRRNVLIDGRGRPVLVDFAAAIVARPRSPLRLAFPLLRAIDRGAVLKHRRRLAPSGLSGKERRADRFFGALGRLWRIVRLH